MKILVESLIKYLYIVAGVAGILITIGIKYGGNYFPESVIVIGTDVLIVILTLSGSVLLILCGGFLLNKTYGILKKPFAHYQEDPHTVGLNRVLTKKRDIIADKIWSGFALGSIGLLSFFGGVMLLKFLFVDFFIRLIR